MGRLINPESLNPCCGGRCSSTGGNLAIRQVAMGLNPCCGGRCSSTGLH